MKKYSVVKKYKIIIINIFDSNIILDDFWNDILNLFDERVNKILLTAESNVFSDNSDTNNLLTGLFELIKNNSQIEKVILDVFISNLDVKKIELFKKILDIKKLDIEVYVDSKDDLNLYYENNSIEISKFVEIINYLKSIDVGIALISIFGNPSFSKGSYIDTCESLVLFAIENDISEFVISPYIFTKSSVEDTKSRVSHKDIINLLDVIPTDYLSNISLTNYSAKFRDDGENYLFPVCEEKDFDEIMDFYDKFIISRNPNERKKYITDIKRYLEEKLKKDIESK